MALPVSDTEHDFPLRVLRFGIEPYEKIWDLQRRLQRALIEGSGEEVLIVCQHEPVITLGKSTKPEHLLVSPHDLKRKGIALFEVERGGDITFHGPGQVVLYPIIDLNHHRRDVGWYLDSLEQVVIDSLQQLEIIGVRLPKGTGVWTVGNEHDKKISRKIASIGVRLSRWRSMHGLSLNVRDCSDGFSAIHPCGFRDIEVTSIEQELHQGKGDPPTLGQVETILIEQFTKRFAYRRN